MNTGENTKKNFNANNDCIANVIIPAIPNPINTRLIVIVKFTM